MRKTSWKDIAEGVTNKKEGKNSFNIIAISLFNINKKEGKL